jgi:hypothetical protein
MEHLLLCGDEAGGAAGWVAGSRIGRESGEGGAGDLDADAMAASEAVRRGHSAISTRRTPPLSAGCSAGVTRLIPSQTFTDRPLRSTSQRRTTTSV